MFLRKKHEELTRHVGGKPSSTQLALIRRIARLELYVDRLDADAMANGGRLSDHASKVYLAYVNSVGRLSRQLGFQGVVEKPPSLASYLTVPRRARMAPADLAGDEAPEPPEPAGDALGTAA